MKKNARNGNCKKKKECFGEPENIFWERNAQGILFETRETVLFTQKIRREKKKKKIFLGKGIWKK